MQHSRQRGLSVVELLVVIGILSLLSVLTFETFNKLNSTKAIETDALRILLELQEARSLTVSSKNADQYGVHFASSSITLFEGASFVSGSSTNITSKLNRAVIISSTTLSGGGLDVIFQRLTGETSQSGTVTLSLVASSSVSKTITIYKTGLAEIQ
jgi:prepilin-type N-terminal cleavage/methylation domain-containing protein